MKSEFFFTIAIMICLVGAFIIGRGVRPQSDDRVVQGKSWTRDTVFVHDTLRDTIGPAEFRVTKKPAPVPAFIQPIPGLVALGTDTQPTGPAAPDTTVRTPADSDVCYSFEKENDRGMHAYVEMCSKYLPPIRPLDLHGVVDVFCGSDTVSVPARVDTVFKRMDANPSPIKGWHLGIAGIAAGILAGVLISK